MNDMPHFYYTNKVYSDIEPLEGTFLSAYGSESDKESGKRELFFCHPTGNSWESFNSGGEGGAYSAGNGISIDGTNSISVSYVTKDEIDNIIYNL